MVYTFNLLPDWVNDWPDSSNGADTTILETALATSNKAAFITN